MPVDRGEHRHAQYLGDEFRPRSHGLQALRARRTRQGLHERARSCSPTAPCTRTPRRFPGALQEGASPCRRHACPCGRRRGLFAALVRGGLRVQGVPVEARLHVHAAVLDVPPALQHAASRPAISPAASAAAAIHSSPCAGRARKAAAPFRSRKAAARSNIEDQDPRIHRKWLDAIAKTGVASEMGDIFDEPAILALSEEADRSDPDAGVDRPGGVGEASE